MTVSKPTDASAFAATIFRALAVYWGIAFVGLGGLFGFFWGLPGIYSTILGTIFGLGGFYQLMRDQATILTTKNQKLIFIQYIRRLVMYAIPIGIALKFSGYFKFWIILICLFTGQFIFILYELIMNLRHYKKRMANRG
jgi:hypothetical protein